MIQFNLEFINNILRIQHKSLNVLWSVSKYPREHYKLI